jgi:hypothetical protein
MQDVLPEGAAVFPGNGIQVERTYCAEKLGMPAMTSKEGALADCRPIADQHQKVQLVAGTG